MQSTKNDSHHLKAPQLGFTIVELLIVVVVIAILAAITIVAFNGIQRRAVEASLKSELQSGVKQIEITNTKLGAYPASSTEVNDGQGIKASSNSQFTYLRKPYGFCASTQSTNTNLSFVYKANSAKIEAGSCGATITSIAGSAYGNAFLDATGTAARFYWPRDIAINAAGTMFIADMMNHRIRQVTPAGVVTTFAGSGTAGTGNGTGVGAQFNSPSGIAIDSSGNLYVTDSGSNRIRKISPAGVVQTLAGSTQGSADNVVGTSAQFYGPNGIAVDSAGFVYVTDRNNNRIRKISPTGSVTTLAGSTQGYQEGTGTAARFNDPFGIEVDAAGNVYVADANNSRVRMITPAGVTSTIAGNGNYGYVNGPAASAEFGTILGLARDTYGTIYVSESNTYRVRAITASGVVSNYGGNGTDGTNDGVDGTAQLTVPLGMAFDANGIMYMVDSGRVRMLE